MKAFLEAWIITFLKNKGRRGASKDEIISFVNETHERGLILPPVKIEEVDRLLSLYCKWGLVKREGERYYIKLDKLDDTIRDMLEKMVESEVTP